MIQHLLKVKTIGTEQIQVAYIYLISDDIRRKSPIICV